VRRLAPIAFILVAAALVVALVVPLIVGTVAAAVIGGLPPFAGYPVAVSVQTSIGGLLGGRIDTVRIAGRPGTFGDVAVDSIDLTVEGIGLDRTFGSIHGTAGVVTVPDPSGTTDPSASPITFRTVSVDGSSTDGIRLGATVDPAAVEARIAAELASLGIADAMVMLMADQVAIHVGGETLHAAFEVVDGAIVLAPGGPIPPVTVLAAGTSLPGRPLDVETAATGLTIHWLIPAADLIARLGG
jgi:hypothetical protein